MSGTDKAARGAMGLGELFDKQRRLQEKYERAVFWGRHEEIAGLLRRGLDVHKPLSSGHSLLQRAITLGDAQSVRLLIDAGADIQTPYKIGRSELKNSVAAMAFQRPRSFVEFLQSLEAEAEAKHGVRTLKSSTCKVSPRP